MAAVNAVPTPLPDPLADDVLDRQAWGQQYRQPQRAAALGAQMVATAAATGDVAGAARGRFHVAWAEWRWGTRERAEAAHALLCEVAARCAAADTAVAALVRDSTAARLRRDHDFAASLTLLEANLALPEGTRLPQAQCATATAAAICCSALHRLDDALRHFHLALALAHTSADEALIANAASNLGGAHYDVYSLDDALAFCSQAFTSAERAGALGAWVTAGINCVLVLNALGRDDEAQQVVERLLASAHLMRDDKRAKYATVFAEIARARGEHARAQALLDEAAAAQAGDTAPPLEWATVQARLWMASGRTEVARALAEQRLAAKRLPDASDLPLALLRLRECAAAACETLGDLRAALTHSRAASTLHEAMLGRASRARRIAMEVEFQLALARQQRDAAEAGQQRLAELNDALHAASRAKSDFLAAASHDLRQPVHALTLQVAALRGEPDAPRREERLDRIDACVGALSGLFDALLDLSRIDAGIVAPQWQPVALALLLDELVQTHRAEAERQGLWLSLRLAAGAHEASTRSDPGLLERVLRNLIVNAVRHTRAGGVLVTLRARGNQWRIDVRDSGPGIPAALHARVFDEFFQAHPGERQGGEGLGLGLAIVQRLARLLGHGVALRSAPGRGSTFAVTLERGAPAPRALALEAATDDAMPPLRVMVIEDDRAAREALVDLLQQWGCSTEAAARSEDLPRDPTWRPDVALLDLHLGGDRDGIDEAAHLRALHGVSLPCLLITGESAPESLRRIEASGLPWLHKPVAAAGLRRWLVAVREKPPSG
jgi:signal transduction histidine kinase